MGLTLTLAIVLLGFAVLLLSEEKAKTTRLTKHLIAQAREIVQLRKALKLKQ